MSSGVCSINILKQSLNTGIVVNMTMIEKMYVQIGSATLYRGSVYMTIDAIMTPTDYTRSPMACTTADLTFRFSLWLLCAETFENGVLFPFG